MTLAPSTFAPSAFPAVDSTALSVDAAVAFLPCQDAAVADLFFSERPDELAVAKDTCRGCPFVRECLEGAQARQEPWGVWGGEILVDGAVVATKRSRGRPRKNAA